LYLPRFFPNLKNTLVALLLPIIDVVVVVVDDELDDDQAPVQASNPEIDK
jgi:hypothetical protein